MVFVTNLLFALLSYELVCFEEWAILERMRVYTPKRTRLRSVCFFPKKHLALFFSDDVLRRLPGWTVKLNVCIPKTPACTSCCSCMQEFVALIVNNRPFCSFLKKSLQALSVALRRSHVKRREAFEIMRAHTHTQTHTRTQDTLRAESHSHTELHTHTNIGASLKAGGASVGAPRACMCVIDSLKATPACCFEVHWIQMQTGVIPLRFWQLMLAFRAIKSSSTVLPHRLTRVVVLFFMQSHSGSLSLGSQSVLVLPGHSSSLHFGYTIFWFLRVRQRLPLNEASSSCKFNSCFFRSGTCMMRVKTACQDS